MEKKKKTQWKQKRENKIQLSQNVAIINNWKQNDNFNSEKKWKSKRKQCRASWDGLGYLDLCCLQSW